MNNRTSKTLTTLVYTAMAIALVTVATMFIRIPSIKGYVNFGDIMIFTTAALIGKRTGLIAGGIGSAIADLIGYPIYAPATLIIKGIEGLICGLLIRKGKGGELKKGNYALAASVAAIWMIIGYFGYECFAFGYATAIGSVLGNVTQGAVSAIASFPIVFAIKRTRISLNIE